ncbi:hypothetical protein JTB14_026364 [Gonioctena quinquepunctata]|nr:hypothetical protein JTB14_026364 [Gonioctena quinquepunctata]
MIQSTIHYTPDNKEHSSSSSGVEEYSVCVPPPIPTNIVPKISLRVLKKGKRTKRNMGQCYKMLKGKVKPELSTCRMKCKELI